LGGIPRGEVTIELVFDPPGHARLPINADEIIDRILAIQPLAGREVTLLTHDTGQPTRAQALRPEVWAGRRTGSGTRGGNRTGELREAGARDE